MGYSQRIEALFRGEKVDRVPIHGNSTGFSTRNCGYSIASAYNEPEKAFRSTIWTAEQYDWELIPQIFAHTLLGGWDFGGDVKFPESEYQGALSISRFPAPTEEEVLNLQMPDPRTAGGIPYAMEFARLEVQNGLPAAFFPRSAFCMAANICGTQQFCKWMLKKPHLCDHLLRMAQEHTFNAFQYWVDTFGAENIFIYMSSPSESNQVISPKQFERFALPYHVEFHERMRSFPIRGFGLHICGEQNLNLPYLATVDLCQHPSIISIGHEVAIATAAHYFPNDIIYGNINPALIQTGTPQQVYDDATRIVLEGKKVPAGFIFAPGCELPPMSSPFNLYQITKAVNDHGWYQ